MDTFDIKELILRGKKTIKSFDLPLGGTIYVRPLTDLEFSKAEAQMISRISTPKTRKYLLGETEETTDVDFEEMAAATAYQNTMIAYLAMKDFANGEITMDDVSQLIGVSTIADYVREISGAMKTAAKVEEKTKEIKDFRKK